MAFCIKCGQQLPQGANFCANCGISVENTSNENENQRKTVYDGEVHKCPRCGEVLNSFASSCPSCGYEIRGNKVSGAIYNFTTQNGKIKDEHEKAMHIRNFIIPNNKEDIYEFMILASSNIGDEISDELIEAWKTKVEQAYQKAENTFKDDDVFLNIQEMYKDAHKKISKHERDKKVKNFGNVFTILTLPVILKLIVVTIWLILIFAIIPICSVGTVYKIVLVLLFIAGAYFIPIIIKHESSLPRLVTVLGLALTIIVLIPLREIRLILIVDIICFTSILVRMIREKPSTSIKYGRISFVICLGAITFFYLVYLISNIIVSFSGNESSLKDKHLDYSDEDKDYEATYTWPDKGLSEYIPQPNSKNGEIDINSEDTFKIFVYKVNVEEFQEYVEECIEKGFNVDGDKSKKDYSAYNNIGYKLRLSYDDDQELMIEIEAPMEMKEISWFSYGIAGTLPEPKSSVGKITINSSDSFSIYIGETSIDDFNDYVDKCLKEGFDYDYSRYDEAFYAENKNGDNLTVAYEGNSIMYISVYNWN